MISGISILVGFTGFGGVFGVVSVATAVVELVVVELVFLEEDLCVLRRRRPPDRGRRVRASSPGFLLAGSCLFCVYSGLSLYRCITKILLPIRCCNFWVGLGATCFHGAQYCALFGCKVRLECSVQSFTIYGALPALGIIA